MAEGEENNASIVCKLQDILTIVQHNQELLRRQEERISDLQAQIAAHVQKQEATERQLSLNATSGLQPKRFSGSVTENARLFVADFEAYSGYLHPDDEDATQRLFALFLAGRAKIWYEQHKIGSRPTWSAQREAFLSRFRPSLQNELNPQQPQRNKQTMDDYIKACGEKIFSLSITDEESKIQTFLDGLLPAYRDVVLEAQPTTLAEAERQALHAESKTKTSQSAVHTSV